MEENKEYIKNTMQSSRIDALRTRARRCKCKYCGGKLRLKQIVYNSVIEPRVELFCEDCQRIEYGIEPEIYTLAKYYVDEFGCDYFPELDASITKDRMNIGRVCEIMFWALNGLGLVSMEGFNVPVEIDKRYVGENIVFDLDELEEVELEELDVFNRVKEAELRE